ncbi:MAG: helix-turn-helix domain-containing protein [Clostridia bacterium]|nr:helix-turn-helix domain-containing protein [Clostridia bacterium]
MIQKQMPMISYFTLGVVTKQKAPTVFVGGREFFSLTYRESGKITIHSEKGDLVSDAGSITYIPRGLDYETEVLEPGVMHILHIYTADEVALFGDEPLSRRPAAHDVFLENFRRARAKFLSSGVGFSCLSTVMRILSMAEEAFTPALLTPPPQLTRARRYMDEHFADSALRVGDFAAQRGVSEVYFRREFRRYFGASPLEYIKQKRVEAAARMLETGLCNVTEAALQSGFESVAYFSAEFRRLMGVSPTAYARHHAELS